MFPYIALIFILLLFLVLNAAHVNGSEKIGLIVIVSLMVVVAGFRGLTVGTDTLIYSNMYYRIAECAEFGDAFPVSTITAPVYVSYAWILGRIGFSHQALLLLNAIITNVGIAIFAKRVSRDPLLAILIYFCFGMFFQSLNGMRQYVAIAIALNAYMDFWFYGIKKPRAWILVALAAGIHSTALIILPGIVAALYLRGRGRNEKGLLVVLFVAVLFAVFLIPLSKVFMQLFPVYSMYDGVQNTAIFSGASRGRIRYLYAVLLAVCAFGFALLCSRNSGDDRDMNIIYALFPLCVIPGVIGLLFGTSPLINRLLWFYMPGYICFIPAIARCMEKRRALFFKFGIAAVLAVWFVAQLIENQDDMLPYLLGIGLFG